MSELDSAAERGPEYSYLPLPTDSHHIRLATLHLGSSADEIRVTLEERPFDEPDPLVYEALSYVWGSEADKKRITINNGSLSITRNLYEALGCLRHRTNPRVMWIDAICIDQNSLEERGQQVGRMGDVYRRAKRVVVWLGPEADDSSLAIDLLADLASKVHVDWVTQSMVPTPLGEHESHLADRYEPLPYRQRELDALSHLVFRDWFERLWVVQEVLLANIDTVIACGEKTILWTSMRDALLCIFLKFVQSSPKMFDRLEVVRRSFDPAVTCGLVDLINYTKTQHCSDPRDKIYTLLGIVENSLGITPDYTLTINQVYEDVVRGSLATDGNGHQIRGPQANAARFIDGQVHKWVQLAGGFLRRDRLHDLPASGSPKIWCANDEEAVYGRCPFDFPSRRR
ncbi:Uu.00g070200.m01.CDS01 [Anthostomella pinea]|uniref:Uu.00g070200.m01.CDS01 n=1 Tax=Anthostomella pinea TaxID=933095 RepID=A0AAI8VVA6_9PEZI|nr:Uu.00g070200.m01.CDS01 [Anthostomella pinea]